MKCTQDLPCSEAQGPGLYKISRQEEEGMAWEASLQCSCSRLPAHISARSWFVWCNLHKNLFVCLIQLSRKTGCVFILFSEVELITWNCSLDIL